VSDPVDDLYTLDPEDFVPARDALVRALRKTDPVSAAAVARLRRPTVAAWALNAVARAHPKEIGALLGAGERLREAQEKALRGDAGALRSATSDRRAAVASVASLVAEVLGDRASGQAGAVSATLEAATVDESVAALLRSGRLDRERSAAAAGMGFGDVGDWTPPPAKRAKPAKRKPAPAKAAPEPPKRDEKLHRDLDRAVAESKERGAELHDAEAEVSRLKKALAEATAAVRAARTRANKAELHAEQLRQRAWEEGEKARRR
jgi:hypothetical protein